MDPQTVKVSSSEHITHDVLKIVTGKPPQLTFIPGQAAEVSIRKEGWSNERRPFTFTSLPGDDYLEFIIKTYPSHKGVTNELLYLKRDDELLLHEVFGAIAYRGEGVFIAGGAGVTPFIAILRDLHSRNVLGANKLLFANKTRADIILEHELTQLLGDKFINILSDEQVDGYANGRITEEFLRDRSGGVDQYFYLCGPPPMVEAIEAHLLHLKVERTDIVKEAM